MNTETHDAEVLVDMVEHSLGPNESMLRAFAKRRQELMPNFYKDIIEVQPMDGSLFSNIMDALRHEEEKKNMFLKLDNSDTSEAHVLSSDMTKYDQYLKNNKIGEGYPKEVYCIETFVIPDPRDEISKKEFCDILSNHNYIVHSYSNGDNIIAQGICIAMYRKGGFFYIDKEGIAFC